MGHGHGHGQLTPLHFSLELLTPPATPPIALVEVKEQLRVDYADDDALLGRLIDVATAFTDAQGALGQAMITQEWLQWLPSGINGSVELVITPLQSLIAVQYYDTEGNLQTDDLNNYEVIGTAMHPHIRPKDGQVWPETQERFDAYKIEYAAGYGDAPEDIPATIRHALLLLVGHWADNREQSGTDKLANIPFGFEALLNMHRGAWYG